ncbi:MAG: hypothetical protein ACLSHU_10090 [Oscillospiraceae bacterium]
MLASIYSKPAEFYWQVQRIEVLKKIQYATFKRNELKSKMPRIPAGNPMKACLLIEEDRTQRQSVCCGMCATASRPRLCPGRISPVLRFSCTIGIERRVKRGADVRSAGHRRPEFRPISPGAPPETPIRRAWTWGSWCTACLT